MNIHPAASVAGTERAAARGGAREETLAADQAAANSPPARDAADATEMTGDRGGDGRQVLDEFTKRNSDETPDDETDEETDKEASPESGPDTQADGGIDFMA